MTEKEASLLPVTSLAYLGDSVMELLVRKMLILDGKGDIHNRALNYVTAHNQSLAVEKLLNEFSEEEMSVFKRGRNSTHTAPKSATHAEYSRATGLECVFAYLYLCENDDRIKYLFDIGFNN